MSNERKVEIEEKVTDNYEPSERTIKELEKLELEVEGLRQKNVWDRRFGRWIPLVTVILAVAGFTSGIWQFWHLQGKAEDQRLAKESEMQTEKRNEEEKIRKKKQEDDKRFADKRLAEQRRFAQEQRISQEKIAREQGNELRRLESQRIARQEILSSSESNEARKLAAEQRNLTRQINAQQQQQAKELAFEQQKSLKLLERDLQKANENRLLERQKPFLVRQMDIFFQASKVAATIATSRNNDERIKAEKKFWQLYYGTLALVEGKYEKKCNETLQGVQTNCKPVTLQKIEKAMMKFARCSSVNQSDLIDDKRLSYFTKIEEGTFIKERCSDVEISQNSLTLAHSFREHIKYLFNTNDSNV